LTRVIRTTNWNEARRGTDPKLQLAVGNLLLCLVFVANALLCSIVSSGLLKNEQCRPQEMETDLLTSELLLSLGDSQQGNDPKHPRNGPMHRPGSKLAQQAQHSSLSSSSPHGIAKPTNASAASMMVDVAPRPTSGHPASATTAYVPAFAALPPAGTPGSNPAFVAQQSLPGHMRSGYAITHSVGREVAIDG
jgi:hypothetical protein